VERFLQFALLNGLLLVVAGSWCMGGNSFLAPIWMPVLSVASLVALPAAFLMGRRPEKKGRFLLLFWAGLFVALSVAFFFPEYKEVGINKVGGPVYDVTGQGYINDQLRPISFEQKTALQHGGLLLGVLALCLILYWMIGRAQIRLVLLVIFLNGLLLSVIGTANKISGSETMLWVLNASHPHPVVDTPPTHFFATFFYHNHWGAFCILSLCAGLGLFEYHFRRRHPDKPNNPWFFFLFMSLFMLATLPLSAGRASMGASLFIVLPLLVLLIRKSLGYMLEKTGKKHFFIYSLVSLSCLLLVLSFFWVILWKKPVTKRLVETRGQWENYLQKDGNYRVWGWRDTIDMARDRPYWGWGLGSYKWIFNKHFAGPEFQKYSKNLPRHTGFAELVGEEKRTLFFRPIKERFHGLEDLPADMTYSIHYNRPLRFAWNVEFGNWEHHSTEVTFTTYTGSLSLDERTVTVRVDEEQGVLMLDEPDIPFVTNWDFEAALNQGWSVQKNDRNTIKVTDFVSGATASAGDGLSTSIIQVSGEGPRDVVSTNSSFARVNMGRYDSNSIWADYVNGPFFRLVSTNVDLKEGNLYTFMIRARRAKAIFDPRDPPVLSLEVGPQNGNRFQEHLLGKPSTQWANFFTEIPYRDFREGNFSIRRSSSQGKAAGAVIDIDDVEVFHHPQPGSIGLGATGVGTQKLRLNFFYKGIYHPVEVDVVKKGQGDVEKWANNHAHNDYLEFWAELGVFGCILLGFPVLGFLFHVWHKGVRTSVSRWLFLGSFAVGLMALVDFPLQNPVVFCLFAISLTLAGKYSLIQGREIRNRRKRKNGRHKLNPLADDVPQASRIKT
jgi:O-antigen ligase